MLYEVKEKDTNLMFYTLDFIENYYSGFIKYVL